MNVKQAKIYFSLGKALAKKREWKEAIAAYRQAIEREQNFADAYHFLGDALVETGDQTEAINVYKKAVEINPELWEVYHKLGNLLPEIGELEEAIINYHKSIELKSDFCWSYNNLGDVLVKLEKWEEAVSAYRRAIELNPDFAWTYDNLGDVLVKLGNWEEAIATYRQFMEIQPNFSPKVEEKFNQALHQQVKGRLEQALSCYRQAIEKDPTDVESYQKALEIKPDDAELYIGLGNAWYDKREYQKAFDAYQKALQIQPNLVKIEENAIVFAACQQALKIHSGVLKIEVENSKLSHTETTTENWQKYRNLAQEKIATENQEETVAIDEKLISLIYEECIGNCIKGWIFKQQGSTKILTINLYIDRRKVSQIICNDYNKSKINDLEKGKYGFEFTIPDEYLDGKEHKLEIKSLDNQQIILHRNFSLQIKGNIDVVNSMRIEGWIVDINSPHNSLELDVYVNGLKYQSIVANLQRDDVGEIFGFSKLGFFVNLSEERLRGSEIVLTLKDSYLPILNTPIMAISQEAKTHTISLLNQKVSGFDFLTDGEKQWLTKVVFPNLKNFIRHQQKNEQQLFNAKTYHQLSLWRSVKQEAPLNVIVPVYRNLKVTQQCLERVIQSQRNRPYKITVINDCSPEPEIHTYLDELANSGQIKLIKHAKNEGFVRSVNNGMMSDTQSDVVLLNSDAYVTDYWLDYLREAVYKEERIATGTPFSNNATIFSYPINCQETEDIPKDLTLEELAQICRQVNQNVTIEVPSGHGFCLYIRRDALREVGYFDAETWGKGYGEEVDWCQRALDLGWRHIAATGVFIQHVGSQSFVGDKTDLLNRSLKLIRKKYPEYDLVIQEFIKSDPFATARRNIDLERLKRCGNSFILMINHNLGGGTETHLQDLVVLLESENIIGLVLKPYAESKDWVELTAPKLDLLARYNLSNDGKTLIQDLQNLGVFHIHIHHTIGFSKNFLDKLLKELALNYDVTLHDYASICPRVSLSQAEGKYCQEPPIQVCELCIEEHGAHNSLQKLYEEIDSMEIWRSNSESLLKKARKIFVPSQDMATRMSKYFPELEFTLRYHPEVRKTITLHSQNDDKSNIRIGLIGGISEIKGLNTLYNCASYAAKIKKDIEFIVIGKTANNSLFEKLSNVSIYGAYKPEELNELISKSKLDVAAFFSTWPETYCYTLSEALENGLYPFVFDIGAVGERVRKLGLGYLIEPDVNVASLVDALYSFANQCRQQEDTVNIGNDYSDLFMNKYYNL
ncbi:MULTISPECIES: tetratricopeptide repeat protein [unclassified Okeania]|uniref:tetratricopeptide repeat protein n=1 Tax=unclassified Okeania TaxID=2634635 RepID=UPI0013BB331C|nr:MULTISPECIES: tetratricopeptide repeat protein [unclassified Okeania]NES79827.1 tetratricopeptide repeat protein [Okeania sp. SIO1H4]NET23516.1 tetratricopeptide repeat protein [Okeania sp. SIO1H5]NET97335.1 tetratricopeptide repeat protein [Okeania sp. SIO1H2]